LEKFLMRTACNLLCGGLQILLFLVWIVVPMLGMKEKSSNKSVVTLLTLIVAAFLGAWLLSFVKPPAIVEQPPALPVSYRLSPLGKVPDWRSLEAYQGTITHEQFMADLTQYFTCSNAWQEYIEVRKGYALIAEVASNRQRKFRLNFAPTRDLEKAPRFWRTKQEIRIPTGEKPLQGVHIAIDAGHIGGEWAQMEERWFKIGDGKPVTEGDMTLYVAKLLQPMLEQKGATVSMVRKDTKPLTSDRPAQLLPLVREQNPSLSNPFYVNKAAESLFYRTSEIRARATHVNQVLKPDLVLCLHFNAVGWGDPANPTLVDENHFHILLNGAFTDEEIGYDDQRYEMIRKILQGTIHEEAAVGGVMADVFAKQSGLPPYPYEPDSRRARNVAGHPYLWARNLLANRLYDCPVIFFEPYVMNSKEVYERIQAGDYSGMLVVAGKPQKSIYREYADAVVDGLLEYYKVADSEE
jgi:N-acetylmuramoyl-L-alanine amidase